MTTIVLVFKIVAMKFTAQYKIPLAAMLKNRLFSPMIVSVVSSVADRDMLSFPMVIPENVSSAITDDTFCVIVGAVS